MMTVSGGGGEAVWGGGPAQSQQQRQKEDGRHTQIMMVSRGSPWRGEGAPREGWMEGG
jgi:hypothetical protein